MKCHWLIEKSVYSFFLCWQFQNRLATYFWREETMNTCEKRKTLFPNKRRSFVLHFIFSFHLWTKTNSTDILMNEKLKIGCYLWNMIDLSRNVFVHSFCVDNFRRVSSSFWLKKKRCTSLFLRISCMRTDFYGSRWRMAWARLRSTMARFTLTLSRSLIF